MILGLFTIQPCYSEEKYSTYVVAILSQILVDFLSLYMIMNSSAFWGSECHWYVQGIGAKEIKPEGSVKMSPIEWKHNSDWWEQAYYRAANELQMFRCSGHLFKKAG